MRALLAVAALATLITYSEAVVGEACSRPEEGPITEGSGCDANSEYCDAERVCQWRMFAGFLPYWGCENEGTCQLKQQLNMTCHRSRDCSSGVCRFGRCVECGGPEQCQQFQYCDIGFFRPMAAIPGDVKRALKEMRRNSLKARIMRALFWWKDDLPMCEEVEDKYYTEEMVNEVLDNNERAGRDRFTFEDGRGGQCHVPRKYAKSTPEIGLDYFYDEETNWWWKPEGSIYIVPTFTCQSKMPDNSNCLRNEQCTSNYCDGGKCKSTPPMCSANRMDGTMSGCPTTSSTGRFFCHGAWDPLLVNQCVESRNCTSDGDCPAPQFCKEWEMGSHCVQCVTGENETACGSSSYCEWGTCVNKKVDGYCSKFYECMSGQCNGATNMCLPAGQLNPAGKK